MRSTEGVWWALGDGTPADPARLYRNSEGLYEQPAPIRCRRGHPHGPGRTIVAGQPCAVTGSHQLWRCRTCGDVIRWPPTQPGCVHDDAEAEADPRP